MNNDPHNGEHDLPPHGPAAWVPPTHDSGWPDAGGQPLGGQPSGGQHGAAGVVLPQPPPYAAQVPVQPAPPPTRRRRGPWVWIVPLVAGIVALATATVLVTAAAVGNDGGSGRVRAAGSASATATPSAGATPSQAVTTPPPQATVFRTVSAGGFSIRAPESLAELRLTKEGIAAARSQAKADDDPALQAVLEQVDGLQDEGGLLALYSRGLAVNYLFVATLPAPVHGTIPPELRASMLKEFGTDGGKVTGSRDRTIGGRRCLEITATESSDGMDVPGTLLFIPGENEIYYVVAVLLTMKKTDAASMLDSIRIR